MCAYYFLSLTICIYSFIIFFYNIYYVIWFFISMPFFHFFSPNDKYGGRSIIPVPNARRDSSDDRLRIGSMSLFQLLPGSPPAALFTEVSLSFPDFIAHAAAALHLQNNVAARLMGRRASPECAYVHRDSRKKVPDECVSNSLSPVRGVFPPLT